MEQWQDQAIVLRARAHGESGAVLTVLTQAHGRFTGYVRGGQSSKMRGLLQTGNLLDVRWSSRAEDQMGAWQVELESPLSSVLMDDPLKLGAMLSACALCDAALPEREMHEALFHGLRALLETMDGDYWAAAYILWEIALLRELGFGLDFTRCAAGGPHDTLTWVSPKSGRAVSREMGAPYADRLLPLPDFLKPGSSDASPDEIVKGLRMNAYFLEHWAFIHHTRGLPDERTHFQTRYERMAEGIVPPANIAQDP